MDRLQSIDRFRRLAEWVSEAYSPLEVWAIISDGLPEDFPAGVSNSDVELFYERYRSDVWHFIEYSSRINKKPVGHIVASVVMDTSSHEEVIHRLCEYAVRGIGTLLIYENQKLLAEAEEPDDTAQFFMSN